MPLNGSVSTWIAGVKAGCSSAAARLWSAYHTRLLRLARRKLNRASRSVADEEDVVIEAFHSFLRRCQAGNYQQLHDRDDLARLLVAVTIHKANNAIRYQHCRRRDARRTEDGVRGGREQSLEIFSSQQLLCTQPPPELLAAFSDSLARLFDLLPDGECRSMVLYKLEGRSNAEIADLLGRSRPTIERRMRMVRDIWREEFEL
ncbi:MAG: sigma-70 family RNA polymerase sigma factor [Pirellulaceae bacterium]